MAFGGTWLASDPPQRSGVFINIDAVAIPTSAADAAGIVALVVTADWGPLNTVQAVNSAGEAQFFYGTTGNAYFAASQALMGEGTPGRAGATSLRVYRAGVAGTAAKATVTLNNTTPAAALRIDALYEGTRGNNFTVLVQTNAITNTQKDILIKENGVLMESYTGLNQADLASMASTINQNSNLVRATVLIDGVALANTTSPADKALTGGNSGSTLTATEHSNAMAALESNAEWSVVAVDGLTDFTPVTGEGVVYQGWVDRLNSEGKTSVLVVGGAVSEAAATAITRSSTLDSPYVVNLFGDLTLDDGNTYSSSRMVSRVAGIIASAGVQRSITFSLINGATLAAPPAAAVVESLVRAGVVPFFADAAGVRVQRGRTTLQTLTTTEPAQFKSLLFIRKLQQTYRTMDAVVTGLITGGGFVNSDTGRIALLSTLQNTINDLISRNVALPGSTVALDPTFDNTGESIYLIFSMTMAPGVEQILGRMVIPV